MRNPKARHLVFAIGAVAAVSVGLLWSWNTLAVLFGAPVAEFKHVLAAIVAAAALRFIVAGNRHRVWRS